MGRGFRIWQNRGTFNRTIQELKYASINVLRLVASAFNRTIQELKFVGAAAYSTGIATFNRTIQELKLGRVLLLDFLHFNF